MRPAARARGRPGATGRDPQHEAPTRLRAALSQGADTHGSRSAPSGRSPACSRPHHRGQRSARARPSHQGGGRPARTPSACQAAECRDPGRRAPEGITDAVAIDADQGQPLAVAQCGEPHSHGGRVDEGRGRRVRRVQRKHVGHDLTPSPPTRRNDAAFRPPPPGRACAPCRRFVRQGACQPSGSPPARPDPGTTVSPTLNVTVF